MSVQYIPTTFNRRSAADYNVHMESNYNENSTTQWAAGSALTWWLAKYTQAVSKHQGMLSITEYGCATGGCSVSPLKTIFDHAPDSVSFTVTMNDLPFNDWRVLEDTVEPIFPFNFLYSKHSMYKGTVAPEGSVHVGFSCLAQHWLSAKPKAHLPPEHIWANQMPRSHPTRALFKKASEDDWSMFLQLRAREFARGGVLVLAIQASGVDGSLNEPSAKTCAQAKEELFREGILSEKDAAGMVMPEYMKSPCEIISFRRLARRRDEIHFVRRSPRSCRLGGGGNHGQRICERDCWRAPSIHESVLSPRSEKTRSVLEPCPSFGHEGRYSLAHQHVYCVSGIATHLESPNSHRRSFALKPTRSKQTLPVVLIRTGVPCLYPLSIRETSYLLYAPPDTGTELGLRLQLGAAYPHITLIGVPCLHFCVGIGAAYLVYTMFRNNDGSSKKELGTPSSTR